MGWELCGYVASGLVLAAFSMKDMIPLRLAALASNLAFIAYGLALDLRPIWLLHALLVPLNAYRLLEAVRQCASSRVRRRLPTPDDGSSIGRNTAVVL